MNEEHYEGSKDRVYSINGRGDTFESILARRLQRRSLLAGAASGHDRHSVHGGRPDRFLFLPDTVDSPVGHGHCAMTCG